MREAVGVRYGPHYVQGAQILEAMRLSLDAPAFAAAWEAGIALSPERALTEARDVMTEALAATSSRSGSAPASPAGLTPRELDVLRLLVAGQSDRMIAETLFIGARTVQTHVANLFVKLGVNARAEAAAVAVRKGLV